MAITAGRASGAAAQTFASASWETLWESGTAASQGSACRGVLLRSTVDNWECRITGVHSDSLGTLATFLIRSGVEYPPFCGDKITKIEGKRADPTSAAEWTILIA